MNKKTKRSKIAGLRAAWHAVPRPGQPGNQPDWEEECHRLMAEIVALETGGRGRSVMTLEQAQNGP